MDLGKLALNKQKKILILVFFVLIVYSDYRYILKAQISGLAGLNSKIARLNTDLVNLNQGLENMRLVKSRPLPAQNKLAGSSKLLTESQISGLLQEISIMADRFGIRIVQMRPSRQAQNEKTAIGQGKLTLVLIDLELISDYHNLGRFIQSLEAFPVFMEVQELDISTQLPDYLKEKVSLTVKTYVTK